MTYAKRVPTFVGTVLLALGGSAAAQSPDGWFLGCKAFAEGRPNTQPQLYGMAHFCSGVVHGLVARWSAAAGKPTILPPRGF
jgi:hypothetical protein